MAEPEHISGPLERLSREIVDPRIQDAADREAQGELIDWPGLYAQIRREDSRNAENRNQLSLGIID